MEFFRFKNYFPENSRQENARFLRTIKPQPRILADLGHETASFCIAPGSKTRVPSLIHLTDMDLSGIISLRQLFVGG